MAPKSAPEATPYAADPERGRLLWRCRRGMKELDVVLERYVQLRLPEASPQERQALSQLLELPDPVLADYVFGHATAVEPPLAALVGVIRGDSAADLPVGSESPPDTPSPWDNIRGMPEL
jgi:antitoxin CptB